MTDIGDMNFDMKLDKALKECNDILGLTNLITSDTCFKGTLSTLLDLILTKSRASFWNDCCKYQYRFKRLS